MLLGRLTQALGILIAIPSVLMFLKKVINLILNYSDDIATSIGSLVGLLLIWGMGFLVGYAIYSNGADMVAENQEDN